MIKQPGDGPIRVLVVEDSPAQRKLLVGLLQVTDMFAVTGTAANGEEAISATLQLRPDVIAMDIHLPGLDGYEATRQIMQRCPTPIVLISSSVGDADRRSINALAVGALAVIRKPGATALCIDDDVRNTFLTTLRLMAGVRVVTRYATRSLPLASEPSLQANSWNTATGTGNFGFVAPKLLAIAASTGGPAAVQTVLGGLNPDFPLPVLLVQHISRNFVAALAEWLNQTLALTVQIATDNEPLLPGHVYLAPEDHHLLVREAGRVALQRTADDGRFCPNADMLFTSVSNAYGARALGVVLTGMGEDGTQGLLALRNVGGQTIAQDEASCVVYGMPRAAVVAGAIMQVEPLSGIANAIWARLNAKPHEIAQNG